MPDDSIVLGASASKPKKDIAVGDKVLLPDGTVIVVKGVFVTADGDAIVWGN